MAVEEAGEEGGEGGELGAGKVGKEGGGDVDVALGHDCLFESCCNGAAGGFFDEGNGAPFFFEGWGVVAVIAMVAEDDAKGWPSFDEDAGGDVKLWGFDDRGTCRRWCSGGQCGRRGG